MRQTFGNMAYLFKKHSIYSANISLVKSLFTIKKARHLVLLVTSRPDNKYAQFAASRGMAT